MLIADGDIVGYYGDATAAFRDGNVGAVEINLGRPHFIATSFVCHPGDEQPHLRSDEKGVNLNLMTVRGGVDFFPL